MRVAAIAFMVAGLLYLAIALLIIRWILSH